MTARSLGEILGGLSPAKRSRSFQPCRRNSYHRGEREAQLWQRIGANNRDARRIVAARLKAAEHYDRQGKLAGKRNGPLGHVALEVLRELYRLVDFKSGRLDPAIATVCDRVRRSRAAVVAALTRLKEHGFLTWVRRTEPVENKGAGPQIRQITNAYGFALPDCAMRWVNKILGHCPAPDCEAARRQVDRLQTDAMLQMADPADVAVFATGAEGELFETLLSFGQSIERKSASSPSGQNP
jgi:hypothetical protein